MPTCSMLGPGVRALSAAIAWPRIAVQRLPNGPSKSASSLVAWRRLRSALSVSTSLAWASASGVISAATPFHWPVDACPTMISASWIDSWSSAVARTIVARVPPPASEA